MVQIKKKPYLVEVKLTVEVVWGTELIVFPHNLDQEFAWEVLVQNTDI